MKILKFIWNYIKPSWESEDGKFSYKRASIFVFVWCMVGLSYKGIHDKWAFYTFLTFAILYSLQTSIITISQLLKIWKEFNKKNDKDQEEEGRIFQDKMDDNELY